MRLAGKVAIVTGGGSGIGRAIALAYAREGAGVAVVDRDRAAAEATAAGAGPGARAVVANVSDGEEVRAMVTAAISALGRLDVLVNSAAVQLHGEDGRCHELADEVWERTLRVNLGGPFLCMKHAIPAMIRGGGGAIINIASPTGIHGRAARYTAYSASKGGVISLTRVAAVGYARDGIRVNAIVPGPTETPLIAGPLQDPSTRARIEAATPFGRLGTPEDVTGMAIYLASDESAFATGGLFVIDGGWLVA
jgi:NAD(P)-dependent dehydrogenase (short-subunit alcohol dehydrogenase family)